jgi:hypothetical protein
LEVGINVVGIQFQAHALHLFFVLFFEVQRQPHALAGKQGGQKEKDNK